MRGPELAPSLAEGHEVLARWKFFYDWDWPGTEHESKVALEINPSNPDVGFAYTWLLIVKKRFLEAKEQADRLLRLDKMNPAYQATSAWQFLFEGQIESSISIFSKLPSPFPWTPYGLWRCYHKKGMFREAKEAAMQYFIIIGHPEVADILGKAAGGMDYKEVMSKGAKVLASSLGQKHIPRIEVARLYAHANEHKLAIDWLEKAVDANEPYSVMLNVDTDWYELREESSFRKLVKRLNFEFD